MKQHPPALTINFKMFISFVLKKTKNINCTNGDKSTNIPNRPIKKISIKTILNVARKRNTGKINRKSHMKRHARLSLDLPVLPLKESFINLLMYCSIIE